MHAVDARPTLYRVTHPRAFKTVRILSQTLTTEPA